MNQNLLYREYVNFMFYATDDNTKGLGRVLKTSFFLITAFTVAFLSPSCSFSALF